MKEQFIPCRMAQWLEQLGYDEECFGLYINRTEEILLKIIPNQKEAKQYFGGVLSPTYQQVFDWARNKHNIIATIDFDLVVFEDSDDQELEEPVVKYHYYINEIGFEYPKYERGFRNLSSGRGYTKFEDSRLQCLKDLIKIIRNDTI